MPTTCCDHDPAAVALDLDEILIRQGFYMGWAELARCTTSLTQSTEQDDAQTHRNQVALVILSEPVKTRPQISNFIDHP